MPTVAILGRGIAALSCAALLSARGWAVDLLCGRPAGGPPAILLNPVTGALLTDLWQDEDLLAGGTLLDERVVAWAGGPPTGVPGPIGTVITGSALLDRLEQVLESRGGLGGRGEPRWLLDARGRPRDLAGDDPGAGRRCVIAAWFETATGHPATAAAMASTPEGWVFVLPLSSRRALVQAMVPEPPQDPAATLERMVGAATERLGPRSPVTGPATSPPVVLAAAAGLYPPLAEPGALKVGDRGFAADPLSGDGTGYGLRTALLACAAITAIEDGEPQAAVLAHYETRLRGVYAGHLRSCLDFYGTTLTTAAWQAECDRMRRSLDDLPQATPPRYTLNEQVLVPVPSPTP